MWPVYGPVSGVAFDHERRRMFDSLSMMLGLLPFRSVWVVGGDFNAEVGYRGVGEDSLWVGMPIGEGPALDINWWNGRRERIFVFFCLS